MNEPVRLTPSFREKVWGKTRLTPWFPDAAQAVGEVWYLAPRELPLLVKLIFTSERLSVQVHPDDADGQPGKTEMWHILEAEPGAEIALGFREPITRERLRQAARTGEIERLLNWIPVRAGETYFTPARTVHAIGAGLVLCEIQQNSDVTYRLWDYGRPRPIHVEQAAAIADLGMHAGAVRPRAIAPGREELVRSAHFITEAVRVPEGGEERPRAGRSQLWICLEGSGTIGGQPFQRAEVWLLPETGEQPAIRADSPARFLRAWAPGA